MSALTYLQVYGSDESSGGDTSKVDFMGFDDTGEESGQFSTVFRSTAFMLCQRNRIEIL